MNNSKLTAVRSAPFTVNIASNGYHVKDVRGYIWAVCRDEGYANIICNSLHEHAANWKPEDEERLPS